MIKRIALLRRPEGIAHDAFVKHRQAHLPMAHEVPELRRYVLDFIVDQSAGAHWKALITSAGIKPD